MKLDKDMGDEQYTFYTALQLSVFILKCSKPDVTLLKDIESTRIKNKTVFLNLIVKTEFSYVYTNPLYRPFGTSHIPPHTLSYILYIHTLLEN